MAKKVFQQYQQEQVQQLPPGYAEAMGAMGRAYESIGQNIGKAALSIGQSYAQAKQAEQANKSKAIPIVEQVNADIGQFVNSGDLIKDESGNIKPAPGKESMFNSGRLREALNTYNITKGRPTAELSSEETSAVINQYTAAQEAAKAQREERLLQLKEEEASRATTKEDRKFGLDLYMKGAERLDSVRAANAEARSNEILSFGREDPVKSRLRKMDEDAAARDVDMFKGYLTGAINLGDKTVPAAAVPAATVKPAETAPKAQETPAPATQKTAEAGATGPAGPAGVSAPPPSILQIATGPDSASQPVVANQDGTFTITPGAINTQGSDDKVFTTSQDDAYVVGSTRFNIPVSINKSADGKPIIFYNSGSNRDVMPLVNDVLIAERFFRSGRGKDFIPTQEQLELVKNNKDYPQYADAGGLWPKYLVASLVAQGKMNPAPGQNREWLGQGGETIVNISDSTKVPTQEEPLPSSGIGLSTIPGMDLNTVAPSKAILQNFRNAGIAPSTTQLSTLRLMDEQARFSNDVAITTSKLMADAAASRLAQAQTLKESLETTNLAATLGTKIGEALSGYPGVFESSGQQYGYFSKQLPNNISTGKRWTVGEISYISSNLNSEDKASQERAARALPGMRADLSRFQMTEKEKSNSAKATADFENSTSAFEAINLELTRQQGSGQLIDFIGAKLDSLGIGSGSGTLRAERVHQLFLMGSLRETVVGPGNPAIYEQELLRSLIPSVDEFLRIPKWEQKKLQTLALVTASSYITSMRQNGMEPTPDSVKMINEKLKAAYGDKFVPFTNEQLIGDNSWFSVRTSQSRREAWLRSNGMSP